MISSKKLTVFSILSLIVSMILYCVILGWEIDTMEFEDLHIVLSLAQMFLALSLFFVVSLILLKKGINAKKLKKLVISFCCLAVGVTVAFICYNSATRYDWYIPKTVAEENPDLIQAQFPYHNIAQEDDEDFCVSHFLGTSYYTFDVRGYTQEQQIIYYKAEYFESISLFMNLKYYFEKGRISVSDLRYIGAFTKAEEITVNGMDIIVFTKADGDDIAVYISDFNKAFYAELDNDFSNPINRDEFIDTAIEQFEKAENCADSKAFLDIGNEKFDNAYDVTELTDYGILADYDERFNVDNEWQLYVLGENITKDIPVILVAGDETVWKAVPLIAVLKELGVEVSWEDENTAVLINGDEKLYLDLNAKTIHYNNDDFNLLKTPSGGKYYYEFVNNEVVVSGSCMNVICKFLGIHTCYDVKSDEKSVKITQYAS